MNTLLLEGTKGEASILYYTLLQTSDIVVV